MALLLVEGFENLGTNTTPNILTLVQRMSDNTGSGAFYLDVGRYGGFSIRSDSTGQDRWIGLPIANNTSSTVIYGFAFKPVATGANVAIMHIYGLHGWIGSLTWYYSSGELNYTGKASIGTTSGAGLAYASGSVWHYIELKVVYATGTGGSVEIKVDGVTKLTATGKDTSNASNDTLLSWINISATSSYRLDDMYICDGAGSANNDFLGDHVVVPMYPVSDGDTTEWTPLSGTSHFAMLSEIACDADTTYVEDSTSGHRDVFHYTPISALATVAGIQIDTACKLTDVTAYTFQTVVVSGVSENTDVGQTCGQYSTATNYLERIRLVQFDPDTTAAWTEEGLTNAQFGFQVA